MVRVLISVVATHKRVHFEMKFLASAALSWLACCYVVEYSNLCILPPTVFWVTRRALSATSCRSASKTTVLAAPTGWSAWPWYSYKKSRGRATARAGARWASASIWTTRASPPCGSSPSAPTTTWPRSLWGWNQKPVRPRRADEESWRRREKDRKDGRSPNFTIREGSLVKSCQKNRELLSVDGHVDSFLDLWCVLAAVDCLVAPCQAHRHTVTFTLWVLLDKHSLSMFLKHSRYLPFCCTAHNHVDTGSLNLHTHQLFH